MNELALLQLAKAAALLAGRNLRQHQQEWRTIETQAARDVKLIADKLAEQLILTQLKAATSYTILTEETGWHGELSEEPVWVIDPLDGSFNYHQNIPFCCVAIALVVKGEPHLGVVYDFNHDELFSGLVGHGAWLNGQPIKVSEIQKMEMAVLNTGFPARPEPGNLLRKSLEQGSYFRKVRMLGSAALALAYVSAGRGDVYYEQGTQFWDVAAGCALVKAAQGHYALTGDRFHAPITAFASNGHLQLD